MPLTRLALTACLLALAGCSSVRMVPIEAVEVNEDGQQQPVAPEIFAGESNNGSAPAGYSLIGTAPLTHGFDFPDGDRSYKIKALKEGYVDSNVNLTTILLESLEGKGGKLTIKMDVDEAYRGTTGDPQDQKQPHPLANTWVRVEANPLLNEAEAWNRLVNVITTRFNCKLAPGTEEKAGYLLTDPMVKGYRRGPNTAKVTNVVTCQRLSSTPVVFQVKVESKFEERGKTEPYGRIFRTMYKNEDGSETELHLLDELRASLTAE